MPHLQPGPLLDSLLNEAVRDHNVLPLTGICNLSCIFCSHKYNPPGTEAYSFSPLSADRLNDLIFFLDPERKIIIGESATRLREGEPLTHPQFFLFMKHLRSLYPRTTIQLTSNGALLDVKTLQALSILKPFELILSLNSASPSARAFLMGDGEPEKAIDALKLLQSLEIPFHGSIVILPHLSGWEDLRCTIKSLAGAAAKTIRCLLPGYTRLCDPRLVPPAGSLEHCYRFIKEMRQEVDVPLLAEPPLVEDLLPVAEGSLVGTPARKAGILPGDRFLSIDGYEPFSRVDAFDTLQKKENPLVLIKRGGIKREMLIVKKAEQATGVAMSYDLDLLQAERVRASLAPTGETLMLLSRPALLRWQLAATKLGLENLILSAVPSTYFGGSISSAGLLTVEDFQAVLDIQVKSGDIKKILLPALAFDRRGCDLSGRSYLEIESGGIPVQMIT